MFHFTSTLKPEYAEAVEELLFFNPNQEAMRGAIVSSIERFGQPDVVIDNKKIRIHAEKLEEVQTVFALHGDTLTGVMVYSRVSYETLMVIYVALDPNYSSGGEFSQNMLFLRLLTLLRNTARRIKGVKMIQLINDENQVMNCPVYRITRR